jgi:hypothetical protein
MRPRNRESAKIRTGPKIPKPPSDGDNIAPEVRFRDGGENDYRQTF